MSTTTSQTKPMSDSNEINTLLELRKIFHTELLMMTLHLHDTREKMMRMLNGNKALYKNEWTAEYILKLASDNKIDWVEGYVDSEPYDTYKKGMNTRLAEILSE